MHSSNVPVIPDDLRELSPFPAEGRKLYSLLAPWFESQGYSLYPRDPNGHASLFRTADMGDQSAKFPHAYVIETGRTKFGAQCSVFAAVNRDNQDVVIKVVPTGGYELLIFQHLTTETARRDELNMTIPVLEILSFDEIWSFVVMPRWGCIVGLERWGFNDVRNVFHFVTSLLKGLVFLHRNLIVHRDIRPDNILVNGFAPNMLVDLRPFLDSGHARFALADFGLSIMFSPDTLPEERLLPSEESNFGTYEYQPPDGSDGSPFYDPFAFDVACLGGVFCEIIGHLTTLVNPLAPFLDRMITPDVSARYTAEEALCAFTQLEAQLSPECLATRITCTPVGVFAEKYRPWQAYNRWSGLPSSFIAKQPPPVYTKFKTYDDDWEPYFITYSFGASSQEQFAG